MLRAVKLAKTMSDLVPATCHRCTGVVLDDDDFYVLQSIGYMISSEFPGCNNGSWDHEALNTLYKLDLMLKETLRFNPSTLTVYARVMKNDCTLCNGLRLQRGQLICAPSCSSQKDPNAFPESNRYDVLRSYNEAQNGKHIRPLKGLDEHAHRRGTGRSACPARFLASLIVKMIVVKLLDEYEVAHEPKTGRLDSTMAHEFIWVSLRAKLMVRHRKNSRRIVR
jgi:hypothetical protein